jgi:hypothetical protein
MVRGFACRLWGSSREAAQQNEAQVRSEACGSAFQLGDTSLGVLRREATQCKRSCLRGASRTHTSMVCGFACVLRAQALVPCRKAETSIVQALGFARTLAFEALLRLPTCAIVRFAAKLQGLSPKPKQTPQNVDFLRTSPQEEQIASSCICAQKGTYLLGKVARATAGQNSRDNASQTRRMSRHIPNHTTN